MIRHFLIISLITFVAACSHYKAPFEPSVNLQGLSHKAADALSKGAEEKLTAETPIVVATISNVNAVETSSALGRAISDQVMTRLVQNGFTNVSEIRLRRSLYLRENNLGSTGEFLLSRDARAIAEVREAGAAVTGTYTAGSSDVFVSLRMIEVATGKVLSSHDYKIPMTSNIETLLEDGSGLVTGTGSIFSHSSSQSPFY